MSHNDIDNDKVTSWKVIGLFSQEIKAKIQNIALAPTISYFKKTELQSSSECFGTF